MSHLPRIGRFVSAALLAAGLLALGSGASAFQRHTAQLSTCQPDWLSDFGCQPGVDYTIEALTVFDDGSGPALFAGGDFWTAGGISANYIAKWDGTRWSALGSGMDGIVDTLCVFDDGGGPALYAGGEFTHAGGVAANHVAKWNGTQWSPLGPGRPGTVNSMVVFNSGSGPALYVGGAGVSPSGLAAKWNGVSWSAVGTFPSSGAYALAVYDDGSGPALYAGGAFSFVGQNVSKWTGSAWVPLGSGTDFTVQALAAFDDGSGPALFAGGMFTSAGGTPVNGIAKWNGTSWSAVGGGVTVAPGVAGWVFSLGVYDDGSGPALYAGGTFTAAGAQAANSIARWNGSTWSALGGGASYGALSSTYASFVRALAVYDDGSGPALLAGGEFSTAGSLGVNNIAKWHAASWSALGAGLNSYVFAVSAFDDGSGPALYAGGDFTSAGGATANHVARWDGSTWSPLGPGLDSTVYALAVFDDGGGPALYAGGDFTLAGGSAGEHIAKWNGSAWSPVPGGLDGTAYALFVFDDGSGNALYAGGSFATAGGSPALGIARWDGSSWSPVGGGMINPLPFPSILALTSFDDGSGPALYAGGYLAGAGGVAANRVAKWDGANWSALGSGVDDITFVPLVDSLCVFDDGAGPALYACGVFDTAGGAAASRIAKWNGSAWSALGSGLDSQYAVGASLAVFDDGSGAALYVGGADLSSAGGVAVNGIARWSGTSWSAVGAGVDSSVEALCVFDDGGGPALYAGGIFRVSPGGDSFLARWGAAPGCGAHGTSLCEPGLGGAAACPCSNPPGGSGRGCDNSAGSGGAQLVATGIARISLDTLVFSTSGETPTSTSILLQGSSLAPGGIVFGQGVRCVSGNMKRMYVKTAAGGSISAPQATDASVHARSAARGDPIQPGTHRYYGVYYSDPTVLGACPGTSNFNVTQQLDVYWGS